MNATPPRHANRTGRIRPASRLVSAMLAVAAMLAATIASSPPAHADTPSAATLATPLTPARLLETRTGPDAKTVDGEHLGGGRVAAGRTVEVAVAGRGGVPANASAVMLNVTVVAPDGAGYATVYPCGTRPNASSLNFAAGQTVPNAVLTGVSADGTVCIYTTATTHLIADVNAAFAGASVTPLTPARLLETRSGAVTVDGEHQGGGRVVAGRTIEVAVAGRGGVPANASAVMLNVTVVSPEGAGFATVFPCGSRPTASSLNFAAGQTVPNAVLSGVSAQGTVCIYTTATTHLIADVNAAFATPTGKPSSTRDVALTTSGYGVVGTSTVGALPSGGGVVGDPIPLSDNATVPDLAAERIAPRDGESELLVRAGIGADRRDVTEAYAGERYLSIDEAYYASSVSSAIGRLVMWRYVNGQWLRASSCSGTVVGRTMVLTADHCLRTREGVAYDGFSFVPGLRGPSMPYGEWVAPGNRAWYPTEQNGYRGTNLMPLFDYAIVKFDPVHNGGLYLGDYTGSYQVLQDGTSVTTKTTVGYPVEGFFDYGNGGWCDRSSAWCYPYVCRSSDSQTVELGGNWRIAGYGCNANGGIFGAGVFGYVGGRWYLVSVNSIGGFIFDRHDQTCPTERRSQCSWYMRNLWGPEFKSGYFDRFYDAVAAL